MENRNIAQRLAHVIAAKKITISDLSHDLRVPEQTLRTWMLGRQPRESSPVWLKLAQIEKKLPKETKNATGN
jgi:glycine cleavage system regulatory protein